MAKFDVGLAGLGVMGKNLALNIAGKGFAVAGYSRVPAEVIEFAKKSKAAGFKTAGFGSIKKFCQALSKPRKILMMVTAGSAVDEVIDQLLPELDDDDVIIDGGNSHFQDTIRRFLWLKGQGVRFIGAGVSGGEEGALNGPSIMPGGSPEAWETIRPVFEAIAAKAEDKRPCCAFIGPDGAGHFVKMVHNGIEYADMQMICEAYYILSEALGLSGRELQQIFSEWNKTELNSYLIEITADILSTKDHSTGKSLVEMILDTAEQKGTGKWMSQTALDMGVSLPTITEAVFARCISGLKDERVIASKILPGPEPRFSGTGQKKLVSAVYNALYAAKICAYAQGFAMMTVAAKERRWFLKLDEIAMIWRAGCIIRAKFLERIAEAFKTMPDLTNLMCAPFFKSVLEKSLADWRRVVGFSAERGIPVPALGSALAYYDSFRRERLPANLLQAQRDYFGAHTYRRIDRPGVYHTRWHEPGRPETQVK